jgi:hypothetical protein
MNPQTDRLFSYESGICFREIDARRDVDWPVSRHCGGSN